MKIELSDIYIHPTAIVETLSEINEGSKIWHFAHVRDHAKIGRNVIIGKSSYVDSHVIIGDNVKIQNLVSVYQGVTIESEVFVGPHVTFTNDLYPRAMGEWQIIPTLIQKGASLGANSTIICGLTVGEYALVAAGSVVTKDVPNHGFVAGNPARLKGYVCFCARKVADIDIPSGIHVINCSHCGKEVKLNIK